MRKLFLFLLLVLLLVSCDLDLSSTENDVFFSNSCEYPVFVSVEPIQTTAGFKTVAPGQKTAWKYEKPEDCSVHIIVYKGLQILVDSQPVIDTDELTDLGEFPFFLGENETRINLNSSYEVHIETY